jgi:serine phosphatase RsbU (regulator of sigma subunit)
VAEGPQHSTVLVVGDVVGHGLQAARRAAFVRTTFAATSPFSDDPCRLLSWANTALIERAGTTNEFVTAACVTYLPGERLLRWAYAGHPPALWLDDGRELTAATQGTPLAVRADPGCVEGSQRSTAGAGVLLYTDGLTEARHDGKQFGLDGVSAAHAQFDDGLQAAVLDAGPNRERMIDEAHAMTVARRRDLIDAADSGRPMVPLETGRNDPVSARSALFVARIKA